jgi:hypothetical protein
MKEMKDMTTLSKVKRFRTLASLTLVGALAIPAPVFAAGRTPTPVLNTILNGKGAPQSSLGANGDFYIDQKSFNFYGPKAKNRWPTPISLKGPAGPVGTTTGVTKNGSSAAITNGSTAVGAKGDAGPVGPIGPIGPRGEKGEVGAPGIAGIPGAQGLPGAVGPAGASGFGSPGATGATGAQGVQGPVGPSQVKIFTLQAAGGGVWNISTSGPAKSASAAFGNLDAHKSYYFQIFLYNRLASYLDPTSVVGAEVTSDSGTAVTYDVQYGFGKYAASLSDTYYRISFEITGTISTGATPGTNLVVRMIDGSGWSATVGNTLSGRAYIQEVGAIL